MTRKNQKTQGIHHLGLTVPDLAATRTFFEEALGFQKVGEVRDYPAVFLKDEHVMITLWQAADANAVVPFDRRQNVGLHHFALQVADPAALRRLHDELRAREGVKVEFPPELLGGGPTQHMMCEIPGGIRLELIAPVAS